MKQHIRLTLAGNPNCGKTSIFNQLTGARQHVGNYAGVTVDSKSGRFTVGDYDIELVDLPGVYSLSSSSPEEEVVFRELTQPGIDMILNVVDSTIPQRSLYLTTQLAELHIPMLLIFNMSDDARQRGMEYDLPKLERYFGAPIVQTVGSSQDGIRPLLERLPQELARLSDHGMPMLTYGADVDDAITAVADKIDALHITRFDHIPSRFFAIKLLERDSCVMKLAEFAPVHPEVDAQIQHLNAKHAIDTDTFMADKRYAMLAGACRDTIRESKSNRWEISGKIDKVMTNKYLGLPLFLLIIYLTFLFTFTCAQPFMELLEAAFGLLGDGVRALWPEQSAPYLRTLLTDGIISGVGGVIVFLPNILFLFLAIAILEDTGYMSRAAYVMDGIMRRFGLQGRSFVPLVLGFGCNVPAIMGTRIIESRKDRIVTIMVLPLMSCGARLPIYSLVIPAFFAARYQATVMCIIYLIGIVFALLAALAMKNTLFKGDGEIYLMELPPYRLPSAKSLMLHMWDRGKEYLHKAATIILFSSIVLYLCNTLPKKTTFSMDYDSLAAAQVLSTVQIQTLRRSGLLSAIQQETLDATGRLDNETIDAMESERTLSAEAVDVLNAARHINTTRQNLENRRRAEELEYTVSGRIGRFLEPLFRPIGFDWRLTTANIAALSAKEVFVSQLGILYAQGEAGENSAALRAQLQAHYTPLQGFCMMLFALLSIPCIATLAVIRRELNSWKMAAIEAGSLFCLAYIMTFIVYQTGLLLRIGC